MISMRVASRTLWLLGRLNGMFKPPHGISGKTQAQVVLPDRSGDYED